MRMLAGNERRIGGVIEGKLFRRLVLPNAARRSDRCRNAHASLSRQLVDDDFILRLARNANRNDLVFEMAGRVSGGRTAVALIGKSILLLARQTEFARNFASLRRHRHAEILIPETVVDHRVHDGTVAEAITPTSVAQQVRRVRHRFHSAGHNHRKSAGVDRALGIDDREQTGGANFVDRVGRDRFGETRFEEHLTRRILADAGLQDFTKRNVLDLGRIDLRTLDRAG